MASSPPPPTAPGNTPRLGRFRLIRALSRGTQAEVWLAQDPSLQRDVVLKLPLAGGGHTSWGPTDPWLAQARKRCRLSHPHIATLFEAEEVDGRPALVLEYVKGPSLAQKLRAEGALPASLAVELTLQVLDALAHAHSQQVLHRGLTPAHVLLDPHGPAKLIGFDPPLPSNETQPGATPPGMAQLGDNPPAAKTPEPSAAADVHSAARILAQLLTGRLDGGTENPSQGTQHHALDGEALPIDPSHPIDQGLRAVLQRALAPDASARFADAASFAHALRQWAGQTAGAQPDAATDPHHATLAFLLRRMRHNSDFPALSEQIMRVQQLASSDIESLHTLTNEILKDVALTQKVLRIVNSAHFSHVGAGQINTVSRAVSLIGFAGIRNVATSLALLNHMENKAHADQIKGEYLRALLAATLATDLHPPQRRDGEEVFIGALFLNLGRMLTAFYLPDEAQRVRQLTLPPKQLSEALASQTVLGLSYEELGQGVAKAWGMPDSLLRLMRKPTAAPPMRTPSDRQEQMLWASVASNDLADVFLNAPAAQLAVRLHQTATRYAGVLGTTSDRLEAAAQLARDKLAATAQLMGLQVSANTPAARLVQATTAPGGPTSPVPGAEVLQAGWPPNAASAPPSTAAPTSAAAAQQSHRQAEQVTAALAQGIQDVTDAMMDDGVKLEDLLHMIAETMYRALDSQHVLLCLRDPRSGLIQGRLGVGNGAAAAAARFRVDLSEPHNLFALVCNKGMDTLIHDAADPKVASNLPPWYPQHLNARSFVLLPLRVQATVLGLIYADHAQARGIVLDDKSLSLLKTLRNQAVMALRQARKG